MGKVTSAACDLPEPDILCNVSGLSSMRETVTMSWTVGHIAGMTVNFVAVKVYQVRPHILTKE